MTADTRAATRSVTRFVQVRRRPKSLINSMALYSYARAGHRVLAPWLRILHHPHVYAKEHIEKHIYCTVLTPDLFSDVKEGGKK